MDRDEPPTRCPGPGWVVLNLEIELCVHGRARTIGRRDDHGARQWAVIRAFGPAPRSRRSSGRLLYVAFARREGDYVAIGIAIGAGCLSQGSLERVGNRDVSGDRRRRCDGDRRYRCGSDQKRNDEDGPKRQHWRPSSRRNQRGPRPLKDLPPRSMPTILDPHSWRQSKSPVGEALETRVVRRRTDKTRIRFLRRRRHRLRIADPGGWTYVARSAGRSVKAPPWSGATTLNARSSNVRI